MSQLASRISCNKAQAFDWVRYGDGIGEVFFVLVNVEATDWSYMSIFTRITATSQDELLARGVVKDTCGHCKLECDEGSDDRQFRLGLKHGEADNLHY